MWGIRERVYYMDVKKWGKWGKNGKKCFKMGRGLGEEGRVGIDMVVWEVVARKSKKFP